MQLKFIQKRSQVSISYKLNITNAIKIIGCAKITDTAEKDANWPPYQRITYLCCSIFLPKKTGRENSKVNEIASTSIETIIKVNFYKLNLPLNLRIQVVLYAISNKFSAKFNYSFALFNCIIFYNKLICKIRKVLCHEKS